MFFLFVLLAFAEVVWSNPAPNMWIRTSEYLSNLHPPALRETSVIVYPTNPENAKQLLETHKFFQSLYGKEHITFDPQKGSLSWSITLHSNDTTDALEGHPGLNFDKETKTFKRSEIGKRDDLYYIAIAANPDDDEQTKETRKFLDCKVSNPYQEIIELHKPDTDHVMAWGNLQLNSDAKAAVEGYGGIEAPLGDDSEVTDDRAITGDSYVVVPTPPSSKGAGIIPGALERVQKRASPVKRAVTYTMRVESHKPRDFVYDANAGIGTFVYVIDSGAAYSVKNHSKDDGEKEDEDSSTISHGTLVSSQAVGKKYGVAKAATLVSVKLRAKDRKIIDFLQGLETVTRNLKDKPERQAKSVVISSLGFKTQTTHETAKSDPDARIMRIYFENLFGMGVPLFSSSGNLGDIFKTINRLPKVLEDPETPIINVGAVEMDGNKPQMSQDEPQLTISAPGIGVTGQTKKEGVEGSEPGTSHSAPLVAGVIATYLNYNPPPWDASRTGKARVQAIKDYIKSDKSSWVRKAGSGVSVIWNGATKDDYEKVGAGNDPLPPEPSPSQLKPPPLLPATKAISIILQNYIDEISNANSWLFFATPVGVSALCRSENEAILQIPTSDDPAMVLTSLLGLVVRTQ